MNGKKTIYLALGLGLIAALLVSQAWAYERDDDHPGERHIYHTDRHHDHDWEHISFDYKGSTLVITHEDSRDRVQDEVRISRKYELFVNGTQVELDEDQKKLVAEYYDGGRDVYREAKRIGWAGAEIGIEGAKLGVHAVFNLAHLLSADYDIEDYEREMERKAEALEREAEKLEARADEIERMADDMERTGRKMKRAIPELDALEWF